MGDSTYREAFREKTVGASLRLMCVEPASELHVKSVFVMVVPDDLVKVIRAE